MIVAGDHASNDMAGDDPDSWRCQFEKEGFPVECCLKGLAIPRCAKDFRPTCPRSDGIIFSNSSGGIWCKKSCTYSP